MQEKIKQIISTWQRNVSPEEREARKLAKQFAKVLGWEWSTKDQFHKTALGSEAEMIGLLKIVNRYTTKKLREQRKAMAAQLVRRLETNTLAVPKVNSKPKVTKRRVTLAEKVDVATGAPKKIKSAKKGTPTRAKAKAKR